MGEYFAVRTPNFDQIIDTHSRKTPMSFGSKIQHFLIDFCFDFCFVVIILWIQFRKNIPKTNKICLYFFPNGILNGMLFVC